MILFLVKHVCTKERSGNKEGLNPIKIPSLWDLTRKRRCRIHGGAKGSGGQKGNRNALNSAEYLAQKCHL